MNTGWIGAGQMGVPMAGNLLKAGHSVTVFDVDPDGVAALVDRGAIAADSIAAACNGADVVIPSIPADNDKDFFATVLRTERAAGLEDIS